MHDSRPAKVRIQQSNHAPPQATARMIRRTAPASLPCGCASRLPMDIPLLYGRDGITLTLPSDAKPTLIAKPPMPVLNDPQAVLALALDNSNLSKLAARAKSACILICDITRPVPNALFLRPIIERLIGSGIPESSITVLVATGLHRPNLDEELAEVVGDPWVTDTVTVANHFARNNDAHVEVGQTKRGTVIKLDRRFVDADIRIATGLCGIGVDGRRCIVAVICIVSVGFRRGRTGRHRVGVGAKTVAVRIEVPHGGINGVVFVRIAIAVIVDAITDFIRTRIDR